jgi:hypothetical protein
VISDLTPSERSRWLDELLWWLLLLGAFFGFLVGIVEHDTFRVAVACFLLICFQQIDADQTARRARRRAEASS